LGSDFAGESAGEILTDHTSRGIVSTNYGRRGVESEKSAGGPAVRVGLIEAGKNVLNRVQQIGSYPTPVAAIIEPFQAPAFEAPYHQRTPQSEACHLSSVDSCGDI
jgi:hypothetical protein